MTEEVDQMDARRDWVWGKQRRRQGWVSHGIRAHVLQSAAALRAWGGVRTLDSDHPVFPL